jgi:hypothetical protein
MAEEQVQVRRIPPEGEINLTASRFRVVYFVTARDKPFTVGAFSVRGREGLVYIDGVPFSLSPTHTLLTQFGRV